LIRLIDCFVSGAPVSFVDQAKEFAERNPNLIEWWRAAAQGDWMLWLAAQLGAPKVALVGCAVICARSVLHHVPPRDRLPFDAISAADRWVHGTASDVECANLSDRIARGLDYNDDFSDHDRVAAAMSAASAAEALASAAGRSDAPEFATLVTRAVGRAAAAERHAAGVDAMRLFLRRSADRVRERLPAHQIVQLIAPEER
jgi:hypothetical protein